LCRNRGAIFISVPNAIGKANYAVATIRCHCGQAVFKLKLFLKQLMVVFLQKEIGIQQEYQRFADIVSVPRRRRPATVLWGAPIASGFPVALAPSAGAMSTIGDQRSLVGS
jgi:hypothetical protein